VAVIVCVTVVGIASGHRVFDNQNGRGAYQVGTYPPHHQQVLWAFDSGFPDGNSRRAVREGAVAWNNLGRRLQFEHDSQSLSTERRFDGANHYCSFERPPLQRRGRPLSAVFWAVLPNADGADILARAGVCLQNNEIAGFRMAFDSSQPNWYRGSSASVPNDRTDMQATAAHEFGHASGWFPHYDGRRSLSGRAHCGLDNVNRQTMCMSIGRGQARQRTLGQHDRHTFEGAYGR